MVQVWDGCLFRAIYGSNEGSGYFGEQMAIRNWQLTELMDEVEFVNRQLRIAYLPIFIPSQLC